MLAPFPSAVTPSPSGTEILGVFRRVRDGLDWGSSRDAANQATWRQHVSLPWIRGRAVFIRKADEDCWQFVLSIGLHHWIHSFPPRYRGHVERTPSPGHPSDTDLSRSCGVVPGRRR